MNITAVAQELIRIAENLIATDFDTQDAFDKYMKEHPDADKSNHKVVEKKDKPETSKVKPHAHDYIADYLLNALDNDVDDGSGHDSFAEISKETGVPKSEIKKIVDGWSDHMRKHMSSPDNNVSGYLKKFGIK